MQEQEEIFLIIKYNEATMVAELKIEGDMAKLGLVIADMMQREPELKRVMAEAVSNYVMLDVPGGVAQA